MGVWNHRVRRQTYAGDQDWYEIVEAHYDTAEDADAHNASAVTTDAITPGGETLDDLRDELVHMLAALDKPIIDEGEHEA